MAEKLLKLEARDGEDFAVISALVQDALVPPGDIDFIVAENLFVLAANRFRWEENAKGGNVHGEGRSGERILCGLAFANVTSVQRRGIDLVDRSIFLELLAVELTAPDLVQLTFAGEAAIRLQMSELSCTLEDFGETWPTVWRPHHDH